MSDEAKPTATAPKKSPWDKEVQLAEVERTLYTCYRVGYARKGKREYVTVRYWYRNADDEWRPSRNGMNIDLDKVNDVIKAMVDAGIAGYDMSPST